MKGLFIDTETSGLNSSENLLLEIAISYLDLHDFSCEFSYSTLIFYQEKEFLEKYNKKSLEINGINYSMVKSGKPLDVVKHELLNYIKTFGINKCNSVIICQNPSFDRSFFCHLLSVEEQTSLDFPYHWLDLASMYWIKFLDPALKSGNFLDFSLSKDSIAKSLNLLPENKPHTALGGVYHLIKCYKALL